MIYERKLYNSNLNLTNKVNENIIKQSINISKFLFDRQKKNLNNLHKS